MTRSAPAVPRLLTVLAAGAALGAPLRAARADPWIPASGDGVVKPMVRLFHGNQAFPAGGFTTNALRGSSESSKQYRVTGVQGIGHDLSIEYDLRGGRVRSFADRHHIPTASVSSGLQDEEIGLNYGLIQTARFADSITLNVIVPAGRTKPSPALGTGRWSVEPDFQAGISRPWGSLTMVAGARMFLDGAATQLRATIDLSLHLTRRLAFTGEVFAVKTIRQSGTIPPGAQGEIYNLVRPAVGLTWRLTKAIRPFLLYEVNVAGEGIHAGSRLELGVAVHY